jgi:hypothetical protein
MALKGGPMTENRLGRRRGTKSPLMEMAMRAAEKKSRKDLEAEVARLTAENEQLRMRLSGSTTHVV